jgi:hypothetical protein
MLQIEALFEKLKSTVSMDEDVKIWIFSAVSVKNFPFVHFNSMSGEESPHKRHSIEQGSSLSKKKAKTVEDIANKVVLYSYWRSSCSWRVRTSLEWKGIKYEYIPVHLLNGGGEHLKEPFTSLNPNQVQC